jgi:hypothetical protein
MEIQAGLGPALMATRGWQAPEVRSACRRALELGKDRGEDDDRVALMMWGIWANAFVAGDHSQAMETARAVEELAGRADEPLRRELAHHALGFTLYFHGDLAGAAAQAEAGTALFDPAREEHLVRHLQLSPVVALHAFGASALWLMGQSERSRSMLEAMWRMVDHLQHAPSEAFAASAASWLACFRDDPDDTEVLARRALKLSREHGFFLWIPVETFYLGWAQAARGNESGLGNMREGMAEYQNLAPTGLVLPQMHAALGERLLASGQIAEAVQVLEAGLVQIDQSHWRFAEPEVHRLHGEALKAASPRDGVALAEKALRRACHVAAELGAQALFRRAETALAQLHATTPAPVASVAVNESER